MATISETTKKSIAEKLRADVVLLDVHLITYAEYITDETVTRINNLLSRWDEEDLDANFTQTQPNIKNFGAKINPDDVRDDIRTKLETLLMLNRAEWYDGWSGNQCILSRG